MARRIGLSDAEKQEEASKKDKSVPSETPTTAVTTTSGNGSTNNYRWMYVGGALVAGALLFSYMGSGKTTKSKTSKS